MYVDIKIKGIEAVTKGLDPKIFKKASVTSLNKTAKQALTAGSKELTQAYALKKKDVSKATKIHKANYSNPTATIVSKGKRFPLYAFKGKMNKKGVVTVRVKRTDPRKVVTGRKKFKGRPFVATMASGHAGIFQRATKARLKIKELTSLSIPAALGSRRVMKAINKTVNTNFPKNFMSAVNYYRMKVRK